MLSHPSPHFWSAPNTGRRRIRRIFPREWFVKSAHGLSFVYERCIRVREDEGRSHRQSVAAITRCQLQSVAAITRCSGKSSNQKAPRAYVYVKRFGDVVLYCMYGCMLVIHVCLWVCMWGMYVCVCNVVTCVCMYIRSCFKAAIQKTWKVCNDFQNKLICVNVMQFRMLFIMLLSTL